MGEFLLHILIFMLRFLALFRLVAEPFVNSLRWIHLNIVVDDILVVVICRPRIIEAFVDGVPGLNLSFLLVASLFFFTSSILFDEEWT